MIVDQLVYGCARLTGGVTARSAARLVERCLAAGVRHVDTAPSYGMGTAERVIGAVVGDRADVRITAKLGSPRPGFAGARTVARAAKRLVARGSQLRDATGATAARPGAGFDFYPAAMARSLERSLFALRRDRVDVLLLHEADVAAIGAAQIGFLDAARAGGVARAVGVARGAVTDAAGLPPGWIAQGAVPPAAIVAGKADGMPAFVHGIAKAVLNLSREDRAFGHWLDRAASGIPAEVADPLTTQLVAGFARLHAHVPGTGLIFASIDPDRLAAFLRAVRFVDAELGAAAFAAPLDRAPAIP